MITVKMLKRCFRMEVAFCDKQRARQTLKFPMSEKLYVCCLDLLMWMGGCLTCAIIFRLNAARIDGIYL